MANQDIKVSSLIENIENIQKLIFYTSLLILPVLMMPFPWDLNEFISGIAIMFFAISLLTLELIKLVWRGRLLIPKSLTDVGLLAVAGSIIVSSLISISPVTSVWGFDFRIGSGALTLILMFAYIYVVRSFLYKFEDILAAVKFLVFGITVGALFSILSFFGINLLSSTQTFKYLFTSGLPIYSSARVALVVWSTSLVLGLFLTLSDLKNRKIPSLLLSLFSVTINIVAISLYSLTQGWEIFLILCLILIAISVLLFAQKSKELNISKQFVVIFSVISSILFVLTRIPFIQSFIGGLSPNLITQITISSQTSLKVMIETLSDSIVHALFGFGQDTFSIAYNMFRPLDELSTIIVGTNFTNASNQFFNITVTRGILGVVAWVILGITIFKATFQNFVQNKMRDLREFFLFVLDLTVILLFLSSFFIYYTFILYLLLVLLVSMSICIRNMIYKEKLEVYVINWSIFTHDSGNLGLKNIALGISILFLIAGVILNIYVSRIFLSGVYAVNAEKITAIGREKQERKELGDDERARMLLDSASAYSKAISYYGKSDVYHRRASLILTQYLESLAKQYNNSDNDNKKKEIFDSIATYVEISVEESKNATQISPKVYANWAARSNVYSSLVGLGLNSYTKSALSALQSAATLNPLNYELYYNAAQLYILNNESDMALRTLNQLFAINPNHVPSLVLAGEISSKDKDFKQALRYFQDAKKSLEDTKTTTSEIYDYIVKKIGEITNSIPKEPEAKTQTKTNDIQK